MNSKIIIGTWPLSGDYGKIEFEKIKNVLEYCYQNGIREFDTAPNYGNGSIERNLGQIFGDKDEVLINTKMGNFPFNKKSYEIMDLKKSFENSLKNLKRKSINTLFLHNPRTEISDYREVLDFMRELKENGLIRNIGLSKAKNFNYENFVNLDQFDVIQDDTNLLSLKSLNKPKENKIIFVARSPLASGLLSGKITSKTIFPKEDHRSGWLNGKRLESLIKRIEAINKITDLELPELAMRFLFCHKDVDKIIFGIKTTEHVDSILVNSRKDALDNSLIKKLLDLYENDFGLIDESRYEY